MDQKTLMERLRNPKKFQQQNAAKNQAQNPTADSATNQVKNVSAGKNRIPMILGGVVFGLVLISLIFIFSSQQRATNISASLDPAVLKGLVVDRTFTPYVEKHYVQISEGQERNVTVTESGSTLPVISRYNYQGFAPSQFEIIGAAPFALSINISSNLSDPELLRYLCNQNDMIKGFLARKDVAPLLEDPANLAKVAADEQALQAFFADETAQKVLASDKVVEALAGSRLFAYFLISKAAKYYREHPAEAAKLINASPTLSGLKKNPAVRKAVQENVYLKKISATLLK